MSSKSRNYASAPVARPVTKGHTRAEAGKRSRQRYVYSQSRRLPWSKIALGGFGVLLIAMLGFNFLTNGSGKLAAQSTSYAFGDVPWRGGFVFTKFPITVEGDTTVNDIQST